MRLGGPIFVDSDDPEELARAHRALGYRAAFCPDVRLDDSERVRAIREAFARHDVVIGEVGVWNNLMDPDDGKRQQNLEAMRRGLALADEVGALCCVNVAGSRHSDIWYGPHPANLSPDAFDLVVANAREVIDSVRPRRAKLTYEMMPWVIPDSPDSYSHLIEAVDRPAFAVHMDVVNIINCPARYYDTTSVIRECFAKLGPQVMCCHLKDVVLTEDLLVHLNETMVGRGGLDIKTYLLEVQKLPHQPPLLLEHLETPEEYDQARQYVVGLAQQAGVDFRS